MGIERNYEGCITHGPWGGSEGQDWIWMPKGNIIKITIMHRDVIDSIRFHSDDFTGDHSSSSYGLPHYNTSTDTICIDYPNEYFVSISGTYGDEHSDNIKVVQSLCFVTNKEFYGPYGSNTGTPFSYDGKGGVIAGFHGRCDAYLDAIGIYAMPRSLAFSQYYTREQNSMQELCSSCVSKVVTPKEAGPWGACVGKLWDDGVFSTVKHINVFVDESLKLLRAIQFVYLKRDAIFFSSSVHGGTCKDKMEQASLVNLDGKDEYLTRISGFYGPIDGFCGLQAIMSITFHTNKTIYGPYGEETDDECTYFTSTESPGKVVGFHGRTCNGFLTAIGVHMEYI